MYDKRFKRIFGILSQLSPYSQITIADLVLEYEVDERTIYRDIEVLRDCKLGVYIDDENKIKMYKEGLARLKGWIR